MSDGENAPKDGDPPAVSVATVSSARYGHPTVQAHLGTQNALSNCQKITPSDHKQEVGDYGLNSVYLGCKERGAGLGDTSPQGIRVSDTESVVFGMAQVKAQSFQISGTDTGCQQECSVKSNEKCNREIVTDVADSRGKQFEREDGARATDARTKHEKMEKGKGSMTQGNGARTNWANYPKDSNSHGVIITKAQYSSGNFSVPIVRFEEIFGCERQDMSEVAIWDQEETIFCMIQARHYASQPTQIILLRLKKMFQIFSIIPWSVLCFSPRLTGSCTLQVWRDPDPEYAGFKSCLEHGWTANIMQRSTHAQPSTLQNRLPSFPKRKSISAMGVKSRYSYEQRHTISRQDSSSYPSMRQKIVDRDNARCQDDTILKENPESVTQMLYGRKGNKKYEACLIDGDLVGRIVRPKHRRKSSTPLKGPMV